MQLDLTWIYTRIYPDPSHMVRCRPYLLPLDMRGGMIVWFRVLRPAAIPRILSLEAIYPTKGLPYCMALWNNTLTSLLD